VHWQPATWLDLRSVLSRSQVTGRVGAGAESHSVSYYLDNGNMGQINNWDELWRKRKRLYVYHNVLDAVSRRFPNLAQASVLEVGCGRGITLLELARRGARVVGLDYSSEAISICREFLKRDLPRSTDASFVQGDALRLPFSDETFDFVYSIGLIEHFDDPYLLLREQYRVLRPGGTLFVQVPQKYSVYTIIKKTMIRMGKWPYGGWETQFSRRELTNLVEHAGFDQQFTYGYGSFTLAAVRHLAAPTLDFASMWRFGLKWRWLRAIKRFTSLDICLVAKKSSPTATCPTFEQQEFLVSDLA